MLHVTLGRIHAKGGEWTSSTRNFTGTYRSHGRLKRAEANQLPTAGDIVLLTKWIRTQPKLAEFGPILTHQELLARIAVNADNQLAKYIAPEGSAPAAAKRAAAPSAKRAAAIANAKAKREAAKAERDKQAAANTAAAAAATSPAARQAADLDELASIYAAKTTAAKTAAAESSSEDELKH